MRRVTSIGFACVWLVGCGGGSSSGRVDAVFDTAKGLVPGQEVKVAGASVGSIEKVRLVRVGADGYRARIELRVKREFLPFHADASCRILPQGLISENYIDCDPGTPGGPPLASEPRGVPMVPVEHTAVPASLQDLLNTFVAPGPQRVQILLGQLGLATAGRGADLSTIVRRANPALTQVDRLLEQVTRQRDVLGQAVEQTDRALKDVGRRSQEVRVLVDRASVFTGAVGRRRAELSDALRRMPALLGALDRTLAPVRELSEAGTPLLRDVRAAAPSLDVALQSFQRFDPPGRGALRTLSSTARVARPVLPPTVRTAVELRRALGRGTPTIRSLDNLLLSVRDAGGFENFLTFLQAASTALSPYDEVGHIVPMFVNVNPRCILAAMQPGPGAPAGCGHSFSAEGFGQRPQTMAPPADRPPGSQADIEYFLDYLLK